MSDVTDWKVFEDFIKQSIYESLEELGELIKDKMVANIDEHVYVGQNEIYKPTYEFRESWESHVVQNGDNCEVEVKSNPDKMKADPDNFVHGSNYNSKYGNKDISEYLPEILAFNLSGNIFGENKWWHNRSDYFAATMDDLKANGWLNKTFKRLLRKRGLTVV